MADKIDPGAMQAAKEVAEYCRVALEKCPPAKTGKVYARIARIIEKETGVGKMRTACEKILKVPIIPGSQGRETLIGQARIAAAAALAPG